MHWSDVKKVVSPQIPKKKNKKDSCSYGNTTMEGLILRKVFRQNIVTDLVLLHLTFINFAYSVDWSVCIELDPRHQNILQICDI